MTLSRLAALAIITTATLAACADRDERARLGVVLDQDEQPVAAAQPEATPAATTDLPPRETTLILADLMHSESGADLTATDQLALERTTQTTLETVPIGNESTWRNPQTGTHGIIAPRRTYQKANGQYCREFTQTFVSTTVTLEASGTACRDSDGTWKLAES